MPLLQAPTVFFWFSCCLGVCLFLLVSGSSVKLALSLIIGTVLVKSQRFFLGCRCLVHFCASSCVIRGFSSGGCFLGVSISSLFPPVSLSPLFQKFFFVSFSLSLSISLSRFRAVSFLLGDRCMLGGSFSVILTSFLSLGGDFVEARLTCGAHVFSHSSSSCFPRWRSLPPPHPSHVSLLFSPSSPPPTFSLPLPLTSFVSLRMFVS